MKRRMQQLLSVVLVGCMVTGLLAGCGSTESGEDVAAKGTEQQEETAEAPVVTEGKKELVFWNKSPEDPDKGVIDHAVDKFNETTKSGYTVTSVATPSNAYKEKLVIAMSSGECPDIYVSWSGGPMYEYIDAGYAQPLDDLPEKAEWKDKLIDAGVVQGSYNGKVYGIPMMNVAIAGVFYNKEIFAKYNLEVPTTISELEKVCDVLVENGITPFALANAQKWTGSMYYMNLVTRHGGLDPFAKAVDGTGSFENESFEYAGSKIQEWVSKGYFPEGVNSLSEDDGQARQLMYQEQAAMLCCGSWYAGNFKTDSEEFYSKIDWFSFPAVDGSNADASIQLGTVGDCFISINAKDEAREAAFEMVGHYFDDDQIEYMVEKGKIPPVKNIADQISDPVVKKIITAANDASSIQLWYDQYLPPAVGEVHKDTCQEIFGMTMTPEDADKKMAESMETYNQQ